MMRKLVGMLSLAALAACSGQDPESAGSTAPLGSQTTAAAGTFVSPTETKTYKAQGGVQSFGYTYTEVAHYDKVPAVDATGKPVLDATGAPTYAVDQGSRTIVGSGQDHQLYQANAATVRNPGISVSYDPRNAQFTLSIAQGGVAQNITFQDPAHRTDFSGARQPQAGVPNLELPGSTSWHDKGVQYLQVDNGSTATASDVATFFYEQPGTTTKYVTYAGYVRNRTEDPVETVLADGQLSQTTSIGSKRQLDRAAFVYGEATATNAVPKTGSATYTGNMIASALNNPDLESGRSSYFQWITGKAVTTVDFLANTVGTTLTGTVGAPLLDVSPTASTPTSLVASIPAGAAFAATASARIDLVGSGGFTGTFSDARFTNNGVVQKVDIVGSSLDGAFYGPKGEEVGASFRVIGGIPDQRVDVIGSFTGAKP